MCYKGVITIHVYHFKPANNSQDMYTVLTKFKFKIF